MEADGGEKNRRPVSAPVSSRTSGITRRATNTLAVSKISVNILFDFTMMYDHNYVIPCPRNAHEEHTKIVSTCESTRARHPVYSFETIKNIGA